MRIHVHRLPVALPAPPHRAVPDPRARRVDDGRRLRSIDPDDGRGYGWQWWVTDDVHGTFWANGYEGQSILVSPAQDLVVVRIGRTDAAHGPDLFSWRARVVDAFGDKVFRTVIARTVRFPDATPPSVVPPVGEVPYFAAIRYGGANYVCAVSTDDSSVYQWRQIGRAHV